MRSLVLRVSRILVVGLLAALAVGWATAHGLGGLGWTLAVLALGGLLALSMLRGGLFSRARREARWEAALSSASGRPRAIAQLRRALRKLEPVAQPMRREHTRLAVLLAELLDADGRWQEAVRVVDDLPLETMVPLDIALVRHTRAVTHLRGSDAAGALHALEGRSPCGDDELDQRLRLLETYARLELGEAQAALACVAEIEGMRDVEESVLLEARVVRAAAFDALGRREEALVTLAALGRDSLGPLAELGQPRVRGLARLVLESSEA